MKSKFKFFIIALVAVIGFSIIACDDGNGNSGNGNDCKCSNPCVIANCTCKDCPGNDVSGGCECADPCTIANCVCPDCPGIEPACEHVFSVIPATCVANSIPGLCELCEEPNPAAVITALGHDWDWETAGLKNCRFNGCTVRPPVGTPGPAGGIIIYIGNNNFTVTSTTDAFTQYTARYLEAAPSNAIGGTGNQTEMRWTSKTASPWLDVAGTSSAIGSGRNNTALIIAKEEEEPTNTYIYAALACNNYFVEGYESFTDWFLPSQDELHELYLRREHLGITESFFWSSTHNNLNFVWAQTFNGGNKNGLQMNSDRLVRPIRAVR